MESKTTYIYTSDEEPIKYDVVFLGIDLGSHDETAYWCFSDGAFRPITKEEYEKLKENENG